ncbi:MAG TPA: hypothetical protein VGL31_04835, partial [Xanthobacteraceae bacterium]
VGDPLVDEGLDHDLGAVHFLVLGHPWLLALTLRGCGSRRIKKGPESPFAHRRIGVALATPGDAPAHDHVASGNKIAHFKYLPSFPCACLYGGAP